MNRIAALTTVALFMASGASAQMANQVTQEQLASLTANGIALQLGGAGQGYVGTLTMTSDGQGSGQVTTDAGDVINLSGSWTVRDGQLCRTWGAANDGAEVCEIWVLTSGRSVDVYVNGEMAGVNAW